MKYPEHEKMQEFATVSQSQGEFLDWLRNEAGFVVCTWVDDEPCPTTFSTVELLAKFHGIDLNKIEAEKRQMVAELRVKNTGGF